MGRQEAGGQASMALVKFPSDALLAVAPSSHCKAAQQANVSQRYDVRYIHIQTAACAWYHIDVECCATSIAHCDSSDTILAA